MSTHGMYVLKRPSLDETGVGVTRPAGRAALVTIGDVQDPERRIPWADVERIESEHSRALRGTLVGLAVGAAMGGLLYARSGPDMFEKGDGGTIAYATLITMAMGTAGLVLGLTNPATRPIYP